MKPSYSIVTLPGDGVGPEVVAVGVQLLDQIAQTCGVGIVTESIPCGGRYYLEHGREWPAGSFDKCSAADAILLGAVGHVADGKTVFTQPGKPYPRPELAGYAQVIGNRQRLDLYANVRPIKLYPGVPQKVSGRFLEVWSPELVDYVVVRENTEDAYSGVTTETEGGVQTAIKITRNATKKVARFAFDLAGKRDRLGKVTCVDKSNIVGAHALFREVVTEVGREAYPNIELDYAYFDAFCLLQLQQPEAYDVVVAPNLVGDVVSDNGSFVQGGMGMAPAGNIGEAHAMFEPVHGSAPSLAGQNMANPLATVLSVSMMLAWLGERHGDGRLVRGADTLESLVKGFLKSGRRLPQDLGGSGRCSEIGDALMTALVAGV